LTARRLPTPPPRVSLHLDNPKLLLARPAATARAGSAKQQAVTELLALQRSLSVPMTSIPTPPSLPRRQSSLHAAGGSRHGKRPSALEVVRRLVTHSPRIVGHGILEQLAVLEKGYLSKEEHQFRSRNPGRRSQISTLAPVLAEQKSKATPFHAATIAATLWFVRLVYAFGGFRPRPRSKRVLYAALFGSQ